MKTCVLHIGMHKTGSSSIQDYLQTHNGKLGNGVVYANLGGSNHSGPLIYAFHSKEYNKSFFELRGDTDEKYNKKVVNFRKLFFEAISSKYTKLFFSAEGLIHLTTDELFLLKTELLNHVDSVSIVAYIRPPKSYMESAFQQKLKGQPVEVNYKQLYPKYQMRFEKFEQVFGIVNYSLFDKTELVGGDIVEDFCHKNKINYYGSISANVSLSKLAIKFLYYYQKKRKKVTILEKQISTLELALKSLKGERFHLGSNAEQYIIDECSNDLDWINQRVNFKTTEALSNHSLYDSPCNEDLSDISEDEFLCLQQLNKNQQLSALVNHQCGLNLNELLFNLYLGSTKQFSNKIKIKFELATSNIISGWGVNLNHPNDKINLIILLDRQVIGSVKAEHYRVDLKRIDIGDGEGYCAFSFSIDSSISKGTQLDILVGNTIVLTKIL